MDTIAPLVVIIGQTASGKSALGLELAERFDGEIICADSWTVRQEVNIGTAKPSEQEKNQVKHHLLDVIEPCGDFTAAVFKDMAQEVINDIARQGKLPIMVGGTGLYINGVLYDYSFLPAGDRNKRQELNNLTAPQLLAKAQKLGLDTSLVDNRNKRRLIRLIETGGQKPFKQQLRPNTLIIGMHRDNQELEQRIIKRVDNMLKAGLVTEVRYLAEKYGWECEALKGIGYIEWREYFEGSQDLAVTRHRIINATKQLAKRQRTWFKRNKSIHWVDNTGKAVEIVTTFLNKTSVQ